MRRPKKRRARGRPAGGGAGRPASRPAESGAGEPAAAAKPGGGRRRLGILTAAIACLGLVALAVVAVLPFFALRRQIPRLPDLSKTGERLAAELRARDRAARAFPASGDKAGELGMVYQANVFVKEAERCYEAAGRFSTGNPRWPYYRAYLRLQAGNAPGAGELLGQVIAKAPDYAPAQLKQADLSFKSGRTEEAGTIYRRLQDDRTVGPYACLGLARIAMDNGRWDEARTSLDKAIQADPQFKPAYRMLATVYDHFGNPEESEILREKAGLERFAEAPDPWIEELAALCFDPRELMRLANVAFQTNRHERAFELYKTALDLDPDNLENVLDIAQMVYNSGNREAARGLFLKALSLHPDDETALYHIATADYLAGRLDDAGLTLEKLVTVQPLSVDGWTSLGDVSFKKRDYQSAEACYKKALAINPQVAKIHYAMGRLEMVRGNTPQALARFRKAAELDGRSADAWFSIGAIMARQGRSAEAIAGYKKALQENPEFGLAHYNLANVLYRQGKLAGARERYLRAIECDPDIVEAHLNLGTLLADEGKRDAARDRLEKALSLAQAQGNVELVETIRGELKKLSPS